MVLAVYYVVTQISAKEDSMSKIIIDPIMDEESMMEMAGNRSLAEIESVRDFLLMCIRRYFSRLLMNTDEYNRYLCNISVNSSYVVSEIWQQPCEGFIFINLGSHKNEDLRLLEDLPIEEQIFILDKITSY